MKRIFVQIIKAPKKAWYEKHIGEIFEVSTEFNPRNNINVYFENTVSIYVVEKETINKL